MTTVQVNLNEPDDEGKDRAAWEFDTFKMAAGFVDAMAERHYDSLTIIIKVK